MLAFPVGGLLEKGLEVFLAGLILAFLLGGLGRRLFVGGRLALGGLLLLLRGLLGGRLPFGRGLGGGLGEMVADQQEGLHHPALGVVGDGRGKEGDDGVGGAGDEVAVGGGEGGLVGGGGGLLELLLGPLGEEEAELLGAIGGRGGGIAG